MKDNYVIYHLHSTMSNLSGAGMDSITSFQDYIKRAKECGMESLCFSEHGNTYLNKKKKDAIESAGMKYIHGIEAYITENTQDLKRDNYHCILIAKNFEGYKEINRLISKSFKKETGNYYYAPRISFEDLINTSKNIIVITACVGGILCKGNEEIKQRFIEFLKENKDRCFLEIQHHNVEKQKEYNLFLYKLSTETNIPLIAGTDTHALNSAHAEARKVLQKSKHIEFNDDEAEWDLTFKTYQELIEAYKKQNCLPEEVYMQAIENTNTMSDMVGTITLDTSFKYPGLYENPEEILRKKIFNEETISMIMKDGFTHEEVLNRLNEEMETFKAIDAINYILLQDFITEWCHKHDIYTGPARGSAAASLSLYALGVTEVNPMKHGFKFWRFMHKDKYSLADIDVDYAPKDRDVVKYWMLHDHLDLPNIRTAEIITFNTIALKGAIRDVGRGLDIPLEEVDEIAKSVHEVTEDENKIVTIDDSWRKKYPELFKYVDLVQGVVTSVGSHPSGVLITDRNIEEEIGVCYLKGDDYPVSILNMKELDSLNFVKEDVLSLENVTLINETCKMVGIPKLSAQTVDLYDESVWDSIKNDTSLIFEVNSNFGARTVEQMYSDGVWNKIKSEVPTITKFDLLSFVNALIRPCGKDIYPQAVSGILNEYGVKDIDDLLATDLTFPIFQESQMEFVQKFCGYSFLESDKLRKIIGKKLGTREQLPIIKKGFEENAKVKYSLSDEESEKIMNVFLNCVLYASRYSFSKIHSISYTYISYECAWLRYYYPLQYLTSCFNVADTDEKIAEASGYAERHKIKIVEPKFRHSKSEYFFDLDSNCIYKGINSVKYLNSNVADVLYSLRENKYDNFIQLLYDIKNTGIDSRQIQVLIKLDFFSEFGNAKKLMRIYNIFTFFKSGEAKSIFKAKVTDTITSSIISRHSTETEKKYNNLDCSSILNEMCQYIDTQDIEDFDYKIKIQDEIEYLGYISLKTDKTEDRPKLIILDKKNMISKFGEDAGKPWAVMVDVQSVGSGIKNSFTIPYKEYKKCPFEKGDIIFADPTNVYKNKKGYWYINKYEKVI